MRPADCITKNLQKLSAVALLIPDQIITFYYSNSIFLIFFLFKKTHRRIDIINLSEHINLSEKIPNGE